MIAHVAEAGEARGRVILRIARAPDAAAIRTAVRFARAFKAELEGLFVEDTNLLTLCGHPFAKLFDGPGRASLGVDARRMRDAFRAIQREAMQDISRCSQAAEVPVVFERMCAEPERALAVACAASGPWNVVVWGHAMERAEFDALGPFLRTVHDVTGIVVGGDGRDDPAGPVVVVVERVEDLMSAVRTAARLRPDETASIVVVPADPDDPDRLEGEIRLVLAASAPDNVRVEVESARDCHAHAAALAYLIQRHAPSLLITRLGGVLTQEAHGFSQLVRALTCPVLLVRG